MFRIQNSFRAWKNILCCRDISVNTLWLSNLDLISLHKSLTTYFSDFEPDWRKIDIQRWQKRFSYTKFYKRDIEKGNPHLPDNLCVIHRERKNSQGSSCSYEIVSQRSQRYLWGVAVRGSWACKASQCWPWCVFVCAQLCQWGDCGL